MGLGKTSVGQTDDTDKTSSSRMLCAYTKVNGSGII